MAGLQLNGNDLTLKSFAKVVLHGQPAKLELEARERVTRARAVVDALVAGDRGGLRDYDRGWASGRCAHSA